MSDTLQAHAALKITGYDVMTAERIQCALNNVAGAIPKTLLDTPRLEGSPLGSHRTAGVAKTNRIFVAVRWQWIAPPIFVCLIGVVTLIGTMWESRRADVPNWKNDPVPLLLNQDSQHSDVLDDEHEEEYLKVRLYKTGDKAVLGISL